MSTAAVMTEPTTNGNTNAAMPIKNETVNFAVVFEVDEHGTPVRDAKGNVKAPRHTSSVKEIEALEAPDYPKTESEKKNPEKIAFKQAVTRPIVGTLEGFTDLIKDTDVQLDIINKGLASKFNQKIRTTLIEQNDDGSLVFQPTDTVYDATALVQEPAQRVSLSPEDKVRKMIASSGLSAEALAAIVAQFQAVSKGQ